MARPFTSSEARQLLDLHRRWLGSLQSLALQKEQQCSDICNAAGEMALESVQKMLNTVPVEELNRQKQGVRVKALRDAGFETVGDLNRVSVQRIATVKGISEESARAIKRQTNAWVKQAKKEVKLRLNADEKTPLSDRLVSAICRYRRDREILETGAEYLAQTEGDVSKAISWLQRAASSMKWLFASGEKQDAAVRGYEYLFLLSKTVYSRFCEEISGRKRCAPFPAAAEAWMDFQGDPIAYHSILEQLLPELSGGEDRIYGLPEDLALEIQYEPLHLEGLNCTLRRYQEWGVKYILHQERVLLGDEMGLGKTVQAIAAMVSLSNTGKQHFMVICPASVLTNWVREVGKHSRLAAYKLHGSQRDTALDQWLRQGGVAVTTFETTDDIVLPEGLRVALAVVDEAHYIKNPQARRSVHTRRLCEQADDILFMTGTAMENKVEEMIELIGVLRPRVAQEIRGIAFLSSAPEFREKVAPVYYRRRRKDVLTELPELIENVEWCDLTPQEEQVYEKAVLEQRYSDARRVSWNVGDLAYSSKARRLLEIVADAESEGRKLIVFSFFLDTIAAVSRLLGDRCMQPINGAVSVERRQEIIDEFEEAPAGAVLLAQIQSGGTGLNIQAASVVVLCEPQFKPSIENQAISRAYRMGQARNVLVHRLICDETVDERVMELLAKKQRDFDIFADESAVAQESLELDEYGFRTLMEAEQQRILEKKENRSPIA